MVAALGCHQHDRAQAPSISRNEKKTHFKPVVRRLVSVKSFGVTLQLSSSRDSNFVLVLAN